MAKRIALVGCGNVGSFHLLACTHISEQCSIDVIEPSVDSVKTAQLRIRDDLEKNKDRIQIQWHTDIGQLRQPPDLTIVATLSTGRADLLCELIKMGHKNLVIEKMVSRSSNEYDRILDAVRKHNVNAWVNCPNRYLKFHQQQADFFHSNPTPLIYTVTAGDVGLGSNAIHFLDMFKWFCNGEDLSIDERYINKKLLPNRRGKDLVEFAGTLIAVTERGDFLAVNFLPESDLLCTVDIVHDKRTIRFSETDPDACVASRDTDFKPQFIPFQQPYASIITTRIVNDIFSKGSCDLPTLDDSFSLHCKLFEAFNKVIESSTGKKPLLCPIT